MCLTSFTPNEVAFMLICETKMRHFYPFGTDLHTGCDGISAISDQIRPCFVVTKMPNYYVSKANDTFQNL